MDPEEDELMPTRWSSPFRDATDGLVHVARAAWRSTQVFTPTGVYPSMAHTGCGYVITTTKISVNAGEYLGEETPLTCVRCLGGAKDGQQQRYMLKELAFAAMYGASREDLQMRYGHMMHESFAALNNRYGCFGGSLYRRCQRLATALYAKAVACSSE